MKVRFSVQKNTTRMVLAGIIALIIIALGAYLIFHKSKTNTVTSTSTNSSSSQTQANSPSAIIASKKNSSVGQYLVDSSGNTLYNYSADTAGVSNCIGSCSAAWPAYTVES